MLTRFCEDSCPFCGGTNACGVNSTQPCWCAGASIPRALVDLVPGAAKGRVCICQACVLLYNQDPPAFEARYAPK
ncbi:cysteine-rich CWC family protein [Haliea sp.]|uniref:cysteine-rich CWC family protein n=1 Tax=Haliea sp. TaxID=1932666 RepID=UPI00352987D6